MQHFGDLSEQQQKALLAMLAGETQTRAAKIAGVDRCTLWRWRTGDEDFKEAYAELSDTLYGEGFQTLRAGMTEAARVAVRAVHAPVSFNKWRAALAVIDRALKASQIAADEADEELEQRLAELEAVARKRKGSR